MSVRLLLIEEREELMQDLVRKKPALLDLIVLIKDVGRLNPGKGVIHGKRKGAFLCITWENEST